MLRPTLGSRSPGSSSSSPSRGSKIFWRSRRPRLTANAPIAPGHSSRPRGSQRCRPATGGHCYRDSHRNAHPGIDAERAPRPSGHVTVSLPPVGWQPAPHPSRGSAERGRVQVVRSAPRISIVTKAGEQPELCRSTREALENSLRPPALRLGARSRGPCGSLSRAHRTSRAHAPCRLDTRTLFDKLTD